MCGLSPEYPLNHLSSVYPSIKNTPCRNIYEYEWDPVEKSVPKSREVRKARCTQTNVSLLANPEIIYTCSWCFPEFSDANWSQQFSDMLLWSGPFYPPLDKVQSRRILSLKLRTGSWKNTAELGSEHMYVKDTTRSGRCIRFQLILHRELFAYKATVCVWAIVCLKYVGFRKWKIHREQEGAGK